MLSYKRVIKLPYYIRHKTLVNWTSAVVKNSNFIMRITGCPQSTFFMISVQLNSYKFYSQSFYDIKGVTAIVYFSPLSRLNVLYKRITNTINLKKSHCFLELNDT